MPGWGAYYALYDMAAPPETAVPAVENLNCNTGSQVSVIAAALRLSTGLAGWELRWEEPRHFQYS